MVTRLDLSHCFLEKVDGDALLGLAHLEVLLLHDNALSDTATASAGFGRLRVRHLDLRRNNVSRVVLV